MINSKHTPTFNKSEQRVLHTAWQRVYTTILPVSKDTAIFFFDVIRESERLLLTLWVPPSSPAYKQWTSLVLAVESDLISSIDATSYGLLYDAVPRQSEEEELYGFEWKEWG